ncbi:hypothetical protein LQZ18_04130 [Lachnospiraceae bacterium ZAX-1]
MKTYKFTIPDRMPGLNEYITANRTHQYAGAKFKKEHEGIIIYAIRSQLKGIRIKDPVLVYYKFFEKDRRRDVDNIFSLAAKFIQDSLVAAGTLRDDNQKCISHTYFDVFVDKKHPRIEVTLTELSLIQTAMTLEDLLIDLHGKKEGK